MIGLILAVVAGIYVVMVIGVTLFSYAAIRRRGRSAAQAFAGAVLAFLAVYLPIFWDHIPTVLAHRHYCSAEAHFTVFRTIEQWRADPRVVRRSEDRQSGEVLRSALTPRIASERSKPEAVFLSVTRRHGRIVESHTGEVLASYTDFRSGPSGAGIGSGGWKFWLERRSCDLSDSGFEAPFARQEIEWTKRGEANK